jgi:hypothetical protein
VEEILQLMGAEKEQLASKPLTAGIKPIEIRCRWSSCRHGRHTLDHYHRPRGGALRHPPGHCQSCGEKVAELPQAGEVMPFDDNQFLAAFAQFPKELIRAHYWWVRMDLRAFNQAWRAGRIRLNEMARRDVQTALTKNDNFAGRRAPYKEKVVAYAQHATATCCRQCAAYWHGLPQSMAAALTDEQIEYCVSLAQAYLELRFPDLPDEPSSVPSVPLGAGPNGDQIFEMEEALIEAFAKGEDPTGLVIPIRSGLRISPSHDASGGLLLPGQVTLPNPGAA